MKPATLTWERVALKWRELAERRRDHIYDLYQSGRWTHYYTDNQFLDEMHTAIALAERWAAIAPRPDEVPEPAAQEVSALPPAA